jgi:hypothetical protein
MQFNFDGEHMYKLHGIESLRSHQLLSYSVTQEFPKI